MIITEESIKEVQEIFLKQVEFLKTQKPEFISMDNLYKTAAMLTQAAVRESK